MASSRQVRRRLALLTLLALLAFVSTSAGESTGSPVANASAYAIRIAVPNQPVTATGTAVSPPAAAPVTTSSFLFLKTVADTWSGDG